MGTNQKLKWPIWLSCESIWLVVYDSWHIASWGPGPAAWIMGVIANNVLQILSNGDFNHKIHSNILKLQHTTTIISNKDCKANQPRSCTFNAGSPTATNLRLTSRLVGRGLDPATAIFEGNQTVLATHFVLERTRMRIYAIYVYGHSSVSSTSLNDATGSWSNIF